MHASYPGSPAASELTTAAPSILIIDDDEVDVRATRRILREIFGSGFKLGWISDWQEAAQALAEDSYDIYLIDYFIGGRTGLELIDACGPDNKPNVFIFLTGHDDREADVAATRLGASDYLVKSEISASRLERSLRYALFMADKKEALRREKAAISVAKDMVERQSQMHAKLAADLTTTQEKLQSALNRAEESEQNYRHLAQRDLLTGLPNRALFMSELDSMIAHSQRSGKLLALLFIDLDRFKSINDSLGHPIGDKLLKEVAARLLECTRKTDTVARLGGDEFAIIATNLQNSNDAAVVAQHVIDSLARLFDIDGHEINTGTSVGIATLGPHCSSADDLLKNADAALYKAKDAGRGIYYFFDAALDSQIRSFTALKNELAIALKHKQFFLEYQPQIEAASGRFRAIEALVRWQHPERGRVAPGNFIPTAETTGLIRALSEWILSEACHQAARWSAEFQCEIPVAVNLSAIQFKRGHLIGTIDRILRKTGLPPSSLTLEITETIMIHNVNEVEEQLRSLAALGVKIAIDDFGTGYSSLAHVRQLPIDKIKVDRSFISKMLDDHRDAAVVESVLALGRHLGVTVVAEGVETRQQLEHLSRSPAIDIQGFYIARPMPAARCQIWLKENLPQDGMLFSTAS